MAKAGKDEEEQDCAAARAEGLSGLRYVSARVQHVTIWIVTIWIKPPHTESGVHSLTLLSRSPVHPRAATSPRSPTALRCCV